MSDDKKKLPALKDNSDITVKQAIQSQLAHMGAHMMSSSDRMIKMRNRMETMLELAYENVDHKAFDSHVRTILSYEKHALELTKTLLDDDEVASMTEEQKKDVIDGTWSEEEYMAALERIDYENVSQDLKEKEEQNYVSEKEREKLREVVRRRQKAQKKSETPSKMLSLGRPEVDKKQPSKAKLRSLSDDDQTD